MKSGISYESFFDDYLIQNIKRKRSRTFCVVFDIESGHTETYENAKTFLKSEITEEQYLKYHESIITKDLCVIEYDHPFVTQQRILHKKIGGFSLGGLCEIISKDYAKLYKDKLLTTTDRPKLNEISVVSLIVSDNEQNVTKVSLVIEEQIVDADLFNNESIKALMEKISKNEKNVAYPECPFEEKQKTIKTKTVNEIIEKLIPTPIVTINEESCNEDTDDDDDIELSESSEDSPVRKPTTKNVQPKGPVKGPAKGPAAKGAKKAPKKNTAIEFEIAKGAPPKGGIEDLLLKTQQKK
jgi:hypothetical protein